MASSALLRRVRLPDAAGPADAVTYAYDRQGALAATTDQNGTTHAFEYDGLGRRVADRVDALGTGVDGAVRRVETARDARGLPVRLTTRDAPTGGAVVNEVTREHDEWGRLTREFQSHAGPVTASTPSVGYAHTDGDERHAAGGLADVPGRPRAGIRLRPRRLPGRRDRTASPP